MPATLVLLAGAITLAGSDVPVDIRGDSTCPAPAEVAARLAALLPAGSDPSDQAPTAPRETAIVTGPAEVLITLSADGRTVLERRLERRGSCAELADAVAVVIAAWRMDRHPDLAAQTPWTAAPAAGGSSTPATPPPATAPPRRASGSDPPPLSLELGAAAQALLDANGMAAGAKVIAALRGRRLGVSAGFAGHRARAQRLGSGSVEWQRLAASAGPSLTLRAGSPMVDLSAELFWGLTTVSGRNYETNLQSTGSGPGASGALRVAWPIGAARLWFEAGLRRWFVSQRALAETQGKEALLQLPMYEGLFSLGIDFTLIPFAPQP